MTVLHSGSNQKFAAGWSSIFGGSEGKKKAGAKTKPRSGKTAHPVKAAKSTARKATVRGSKRR